MDLKVVPDIKCNKLQAERIGEFYYNRKENSIYFEMPYPLPVKLKITNWDYVEVTHGFRNLPTILTGGINEDFVCKDLEVIKHLQQGQLLLHGSCVTKGEEGLLIVGFPQTGKTYGTYTRVASGWSLISEEYTVIDGTKAYPLKETVRSCFSRKTLKDAKIKITWKEELS